MLQSLWDFFTKEEEDPKLLQPPAELINQPEPIEETPKPKRPPKGRKPKEETALATTESQDLTLPEIIKSEVNFLVFPFFALTPYDLKKKTKTEYREIIVRDGKKLEVLWQVSSNPEYGYLGPFDREVHKAVETILSKILQEKGTVENPISLGSFLSLAKRMGLKGKPGRYI